MLLDKEAISKCVESLTLDSFYHDVHQYIYKAIINLYEKNTPIDLVTLTSFLRKNNQLDSVGGSVYLTDILDSVPTAAAPMEDDPTYFFSLCYLGMVKEKLEVKELLSSSSKKQTSTPQIKSSIKIDLPKDKMITELDYIWVKGSVSEEVEQVFVNGQKAHIQENNKQFKIAVPIEKLGKNVFLIEAVDKAMNIVRKTKRIFKKASFVDVKESGEESDAILRMAELSFFSGYKDKTFHPEKHLSRAEFASLLAKIKKLKLSNPVDKMYKDVPLNYWATPYIEAIVKSNIMEPYSNDYFQPKSKISHNSAVIIIAKFDDLVPPKNVLIRSFNDLPLTYSSAPWAEVAKKVGILKGIDLLKPDDYLTRGEAALWLYRTEEVKNHLNDLNNWDKGF